MIERGSVIKNTLLYTANVFRFPRPSQSLVTGMGLSRGTVTYELHLVLLVNFLTVEEWV